MNEGNCSYPDVNCTCTEEWEGDQCEIRMYEWFNLMGSKDICSKVKEIGGGFFLFFVD